MTTGAWQCATKNRLFGLICGALLTLFYCGLSPASEVDADALQVFAPGAAEQVSEADLDAVRGLGFVMVPLDRLAVILWDEQNHCCVKPVGSGVRPVATSAVGEFTLRVVVRQE
jgi:hypothetical protein